MREKRTVQSSIFELYPDHEIGRDLQAMSASLDAHLDWLDWVQADVGDRNVEECGRKGLPIESVLRCAVLKQYRQLSYSERVFCLMDSAACQAFARLPMGWFPKKTVLQGTIGAIRPATWERINRQLLLSAQRGGVEKGRMVRVDSTVTDAPIHAPSDNTLLWDSVRTVVRLLQQAQELAGAAKWNWHDHRRVAKKRMGAIEYTRGAKKKARLYADLIEVTRKSLGYIEAADRTLCGCGVPTLARAKERGVQDVAFHKKRGLKIEAMAKSRWVYRKLRNFRAGIEAGISWLKRAYGLGRCTWKGLAHFKAYIWSAVVAHNLALLGRLNPTWTGSWSRT